MAESKKDEAGNQDDEMYEVEKIVDSKIRDGKKWYLLKWAGWPSDSNSWEKEENLSCPDLIASFEEKQSRRFGAEERARHEPKVKPLFGPNEPDGFDLGLEAEAITGVTKIGTEIIYFVKWKNEAQHGIILSDVAEKKCPQLVIEYMESNLRRTDEQCDYS